MQHPGCKKKKTFVTASNPTGIQTEYRQDTVLEHYRYSIFLSSS
jgi:hypothetical protein